MTSTTVPTSSFQKRTKPSSTSILGTKISSTNSILHVSSGITSLDEILEEDEYGSFARTITKYFLAEGIHKQNYVLVASMNENPWDLLNSLPSPVTETRDVSAATIEMKEELKIAWRYENLSLDSDKGKTGNTFDLSSLYCLNEEVKKSIEVWDGETPPTDLSQGTFRNPWCLSLVQSVMQSITKWNLDSGNSSNLLRIVVSSFGSPFWHLNEKTAKDFTATLLLLKSLCRSANVVIVITIPHHLLNDVVVSRSRGIADIVFRLKSLREDRHLQDLMDVHGILEMKKLANFTSLKPVLGQDGTTTYGFKATKRKFKIEQKLCLPPALDKETTEEQSARTSVACGSGSSNKKSLDF
nr:EOG090X0ALT [Eubosmina coregoni]